MAQLEDATVAQLTAPWNIFSSQLDEGQNQTRLMQED